MIVKDGWKLMIPYTEDSKVLNVLYNLNEDPHEMNNLIRRKIRIEKNIKRKQKN